MQRKCLFGGPDSGHNSGSVCVNQAELRVDTNVFTAAKPAGSSWKEISMKRTLADLLEKKGSQVYSIAPGATVYDAVKVMAERSVGALLVMEGERLVGMLSERDYARRVILEGRASKDTAVREIMTARVVYGRPEQSVEDAMAIMSDKKFRHLPVIQDEKVVGIITLGDVVKDLLSEKEFLIEQLENYISGW